MNDELDFNQYFGELHRKMIEFRRAVMTGRDDVVTDGGSLRDVKKSKQAWNEAFFDFVNK